MGDTTKGDPILRVVLIVFVGLLVFGFLFGTNFGGTGYAGNNVGHHGMATTAGGYGGGAFFGGIIPGLIGFLMHLLILVLVFALIAGLIMGVRKFTNQPDGFLKSSKAVEYVNQDPVLRTMAIVLAVVFGLYFITALFNGMQFGGGYSASPQVMLFMLIGFLVKLLMLALVITLTVALVQYLKAQFDNEQEVSQQANGASVIQAEPPAQLSSPPAFNPNGNKPGDKPGDKREGK
ncbi:DUF5326 family protein [Sporomusa sp.]|uniref:DUF5326 family protein n=1 Tax=Sporomusa sp. TaxID=2078658 RepID=UPI002CBCF638|nr:DUF5326 family protein [Sporomusa sp.]HWR43462.1 DUF5326 family protein [Sporomusa sp.]